MSNYSPVGKNELGCVALDVGFFHAALKGADGAVEFGDVVIYVEFF